MANPKGQLNSWTLPLALTFALSVLFIHYVGIGTQPSNFFAAAHSNEHSESALASPLRNLLDALHIHGIGPNFDGAQTELMDDLTQLSFITQFEQLAGWLETKCEKMGVDIDVIELKSEVFSCFEEAGNVLLKKLTEIVTTIQKELLHEFLDLLRVKWSLTEPLVLTSKQKRLVIDHFFRPICSTLMKPEMRECDLHKYKTMGKANACRADFDREGEELIWISLEDFCREDAAWLLEFLEADPLKCTREILGVLQKDVNVERMRILNNFRPKASGLDSLDAIFKVRRMESRAELCNMTEIIGGLLSDTLITPCDRNLRPGEILLDTFKNTVEFGRRMCPGPTGRKNLT